MLWQQRAKATTNDNSDLTPYGLVRVKGETASDTNNGTPSNGFPDESSNGGTVDKQKVLDWAANRYKKDSNGNWVDTANDNEEADEDTVNDWKSTDYNIIVGCYNLMHSSNFN